MRDKNKKTIAHEAIRVSGYHSGTRNGYTEAAGNCGFSGGLFFYASDRRHAVAPGYEPSETMKARGLRVSGYGLEVEMVNPAISGDVLANVTKSYVFGAFDSALWKFESDCTVDLECISQVMSHEFIRNNYAAFHQLFKRLAICGGTTDDPRVGMHINISLSQFGRTSEAARTAAAAFWALMSRPEWDALFCAATNRRESARTYCGRVTSEEYDTSNSHGRALNYSHIDEGSGRVEFRFVAGQRDFRGFRDTMELIFFAVKRIKSIKNPLTVTPAQFFRGCNKYVVSALRRVDLTPAELREIAQNADLDTDYTLHDQ